MNRREVLKPGLAAGTGILARVATGRGTRSHLVIVGVSLRGRLLRN